MIEGKVEVRGIKELNKAFKATDADVAKELKIRFRAIADNVASKARGKVPSKSGRAAASIKARSSTRGASVAFGGNAAPYFPWLDFGGSVGRGHKEGKAWSGAIKRDWKGVPSGEGRYVYPAISEEREATALAAGDAVVDAAKAAGFETKDR